MPPGVVGNMRSWNEAALLACLGVGHAQGSGAKPLPSFKVSSTQRKELPHMGG